MEAFVHGANDTANATSAFTAIWVAYTDGLYACSLVEAPWWIMSIAGFFVGVGSRALYWAPAIGIFLSLYCSLRQAAL